MLERLRQGPGEEARREVAPTTGGPPPSRWMLRTIRATFPDIKNYTLSGVWRWLRRRVGVKLRTGRVQQFSPDPKYRQKVRKLKRCLKEVARSPRETVLVFLDEMGYSIWPDPARDWGEVAPAQPPQADRQKSNNGLWRIIGALNARTGKVTHQDNYIVGRRAIVQLYKLLAKTYRHAKTVYVVQDNWSIHTHPDVLNALKDYPRIKPVWLPTYAPWLNPIEKLWKWLKEDVIKMHHLASDWPKLRQRVNDFLNQFDRPSKALLHYTGLSGDGQLAAAMQYP